MFSVVAGAGQGAAASAGLHSLGILCPLPLPPPAPPAVPPVTRPPARPHLQHHLAASACNLGSRGLVSGLCTVCPVCVLGWCGLVTAGAGLEGLGHAARAHRVVAQEAVQQVGAEVPHPPPPPPRPRPAPAPAPGPRVGGVLAAEVEQGARRPHLQRRAAVAARGLAARQRGQGAHVPPRALTPVRVIAGLPRAQREPAMQIDADIKS